MSFLSFSFLVFLSGVVPAYWLVPLALRKPWLLLASLGFYAAAYPPHAALIAGLTVAVFVIGQRVGPMGEDKDNNIGKEKDPGRWIFVFGILLCVFFLCFFKYARLIVHTVADLGGPALPVPDVRIPLGISFFTFEFVHYLYDLRRGRIVRQNFLDFSLFSLFFPTLLSGPIKRYQVFVSEGPGAPGHGGFRATYLAEGLSRMIVGMGKKLIVADSMTSFTVRLLTPDQVTGPGLFVAMYAYAVKIYFDFSGYSDLAIGAARLFGYRVPENFDHPYGRRDLSEFWRHWHMSLSSWIRDYLFIPLGGSRVSPLRATINLVLVMALCGLWHGASWNFVVWGMWHGVGLAALRIMQRRRGAGPDVAAAPGRVRNALMILLTFHYVCFGWVLFAAPSLKVALVAFHRMFTWAQ